LWLLLPDAIHSIGFTFRVNAQNTKKAVEQLDAIEPAISRFLNGESTTRAD
jgi:hypothetical protein